MKKAAGPSRDLISPICATHSEMNITPEDRDLIGPKGKTIRAFRRDGAESPSTDSGLVTIAACWWRGNGESAVR